MAETGAARDPARLPWLEPYRAPPRKKSNRRPGVAVAVGVIGLAAVVTLLNRDMVRPPAREVSAPQASVVLPAPADLGPPIVIAPLQAREEQAEAAPRIAARTPRPRPARKIRATPQRAAYDGVVDEQMEQPAEPEPSAAALAIASLPLPPDPPRPAVNPSARLVRGKTVQLGVYKTPGQAEAAWRSAIRDYTFLVTMPKHIEAISLRSKRFYRLQLGTPSKRHAKELCANLKTTGRACTVA